MTEPTRPTDDELDALVRAHLALHPLVDAYDVLDAIRAGGWQVQPFQAAAACEKVRPIPTLATVTDAVEFMTVLRERYDGVAVFWDRGWGDNGERADITVIVEIGGSSDGNVPFARLTDGVYRDLVADGLVAGDSYGGYKARRYHEFLPTVIV
ncbi:hypothetical protein ACFFX1_55390 [Dactylosporangium sucinum]|uniref:Uncharacterized protein n=1 Tax=Dactylosporangium sucinum TaxID=1424081 RepID=A0A917X1I2_9ACTN|nr:hypothetical protein [Dactylosporangium sucinum]GGM52724.1 hypothetical protein GCM10007977_062860 [Dactylosporangium sucinum]